MTDMLAVPPASKRKPSPSVVETLLPMVAPVTVSPLRVPVVFRMMMLLWKDPVIVELLMLAVSKRSMKSSPLSPALPDPIALPLFWRVLLASVNPLTVVPRMPSSRLFWMIIRVRLMPAAFDKRIPGPLVLWIVPPEPGVPVPVTVKVPLAVLRTMPFVPPLVEMPVNESVPPEVARLTAAALAVVTLTSPTVRLVAPLAVSPCVPEAGWMFRPRTASLVAMVTLP
ncbi:MAG: hypothetical protein LC708_00970 [Actinobacteria bacterium]|nr:hypothetical protein [Actinomycetota bacterium]